MTRLAAKGHSPIEIPIRLPSLAGWQTIYAHPPAQAMHKNSFVRDHRATEFRPKGIAVRRNGGDAALQTCEATKSPYTKFPEAKPARMASNALR